MLYSEYLQNKYPYQIDAHIFLLQRKHACLFFKPGKGKTYPCIDAVRDIDVSKKGKAKVLVLSTANAINNMWLEEIEPQNIMPKDTVYCSFSSAIVEKRKQQLLKVKWDIIIVDESHKVKSHNSKTSRLVYSLTKRVEYVFGLSGTPRGNSDIDIFCQFHNLNVLQWGDVSYTYFVNNCCDVEIKFYGGQVIKVPIGINEKYKAGWERNIAMYTRRVDYTEEDSMPPLVIKPIYLKFEPTKEYINAEDGIIKLSNYETTMSKLAAINKAHQAANGYLYYEENEVKKVYSFKRNDKLHWLADCLNDEPTVIVYRFKKDYDDICETFNELDISYTEDINKFKLGNINVLLLQCSRCESFNLQMAKICIFYTLDYSYINFEQMLHRLWRKGQEDEVKIKVLIFKDSIEEKIYNAVKNKRTFAQLFYDIKDVV